MADVPRQRHGGSFDRRKRRSGAAASDVSDEGIELTNLRELCQTQNDQLEAIHHPVRSTQSCGVYNMQKGEREQMAADIWTADFAAQMHALKEANPELVAVLVSQTANSTPQTAIAVGHKQRQLEGIMLNIVRAQSTHKVPMLTAALSVMCEANLVKREFHDSITFMMKGALMSETWVTHFMPEAARMRPSPAEPMIPGVMVTVFDNLTMNVAYHSMSSGGKTGEQLDMTNWFAVRVPRALAPNLDGMQSCA